MKDRIAYIDDNQLNLDCIEMIFREDFEVSTFKDPDAFLKSLARTPYAAIMSDIHMPATDGFLLYEKIVSSGHFNGCPILFISSDDSEAARIQCLGLGAVDFLNRNTLPDEMIARVKSKIQFFEKHRSIIEFGDLKVNLTLLKTSLAKQEIPLTFIELKILCLVLRNYPDPVVKETLAMSVWRNVHVSDSTIHTHISNLNNKLSAWDHEVSSIKGKGLRLVKK